MWSLRDDPQTAPVIGCDQFLADVLAASLPGERRVVYIDGEPGTGKTHRIRAAGFVLPETNHLKVPIDAPSAVTAGAEEFARHLCRLAGATLPPLAAPVQGDSTLPAWRKDVLLPMVVRALQDARGGRLVWVLLRDLNRCPAFGDGTSDLLYLLYQQVLTNPWLRFILDGMAGTISVDVSRMTTVHTIPMISEPDIGTYLRRRAVELGLDPDGLGLPAWARGLHRDYLQHWNDPGKRAGAAGDLVYRVGLVVGDFLATAGY